VKIKDVSLFRVGGRQSRPAFPAGDRQAQQLDVYPEFNQRSAADDQSNVERQVHAIYVAIHTDEGVSGLFGPIEDDQAYVISKWLRPFLIGRDPLATESLTDQMLRMHRHGRSGLFVTGISSVDCALWDLKGKAWGQPVYRLLGGPVRSSVPAYASMLGFSVEPEQAGKVAREFVALGYTAQKWFFRYGPGDGEAGKELNLAMAQAVRAAVGPHYGLMFDAFMGWDVPYARDMVRMLEPLNPTWVEEPLPPERIAGLRKVRGAATVPVATGEHVFTRWQVKELLVQEAVDVLQPDPDWTGGISELVKLCALASAFDVPLVAHGHSLLPALHVAGAQSPTTVPYVEYLIRHQETKQFFHKPMYRPDNGVVKLPTLPGLGLVLNNEKVETVERLDPKASWLSRNPD
jgi:L-alanine-DL-glutamate epimerase-like enolase superfamily enzyme